MTAPPMKDDLNPPVPRREFMLGSGAALLAAALPATYQRLASAGESRSSDVAVPVRTITAGVTVDPANPEAAVKRAGGFLSAARRRLEAAGLTVQTTRIVTQPQADYARDLPVAAFGELLQVLQAAAQPHSLAIGPRWIDDDAELTIAPAVMAATLGISSTIVIGSAATDIQRPAVDAAARVIRRIADTDAAANFNFAAIANVAPGIPFFPAGYHDGGGDRFAVGLEAAGLFLSVCRERQDPVAAGPALAAAYAQVLRRVAALCADIERDTGWKFGGIDPTPAQWGTNSIGAAVEQLTGAPFGAPGTLAACRTLTGVIRSVPVRQTGYRGLFLPPMEDATLARRAYDYFSLDALLAYSSVCGTGLDTVALPGDASIPELQRILLDVASLAVKLDKPLTARLFPVPGRSAGESTGPVGDLFPMKILRIR